MSEMEVHGFMSENELNESAVSEIAEHSQDSQEEIDGVSHGDEEQKEKLLKLPLSRVKAIVKLDPDVNLITQEAVFLITKSAELFIDSLAKESYKYTAQNKKKTVQKRDVEIAIENVDGLVFLEGALE
ncbi:DNA polymerase epsilon subunit 4 [Neodiprion pinetum]|uniref:DNA polymerase epsilon subunit 4 n=1 Tax=Neodiprion lecontei TaxID=441921 RepID=A0A6J0BHV3_NEOLC|nr:DNA polymerase epsilon subunit 4 [Neodiprion lecontei]XP_046475923.1 DNA polymerase epsilon subunit 4 [Neodiprion pinetum]XP_046475924.1 DNA polymerase epsilon subunit 4 [Neodiprion pinetum]XP_046594527.1 DNA polymerase epsilon subunit 4 [Neodiprion lecontei]